MYILSSVFFAAVRYFHVCHEYQEAADYFYPDRRLASYLYLFPILLIPYMLWPSDSEAWLLAKSYYLVLHPWFCSLLLFNYFGKVKEWHQWKRSAQYLSIPLAIAMIALTALAVWPGPQLDAIVGAGPVPASSAGPVSARSTGLMPDLKAVWTVILSLTAITVTYCGLSIWKVRQWIGMHSDDDYSSPDDFPSRYARRVMVLPLLHTIPVWAVVIADSRMGMAILQALLTVFNIIFLIYVLHSHRSFIPTDNDTVEDDNVVGAGPVPARTRDNDDNVGAGPVPARSADPAPPQSHDTVSHDSQKDDSNTTTAPESSPSAENYKTNLIKAEIHKAVVEEQLFLKPHLTLEDVASKCRYGRTYLSKVFKQEFGGFFNYINSLRLNYAEEYMRQHPLATLDEVATASGFTSRQAFYTVKRRLRDKSDDK